MHPDVQSMAMHNPVIKADSVKRLLMHKNPLVAMEASKHYLATTEDIDHAVGNHPNIALREMIQAVRKN